VKKFPVSCEKILVDEFRSLRRKKRKNNKEYENYRGFVYKIVVKLFWVLLVLFNIIKGWFLD
jgi:hypothetical protein